MSALENLYDELRGRPLPKGFSTLAEDLDISIYQYAAGIVGYVNSYLSGKKVDIEDIHIDEELGQRIEKCIAELDALKAYKEKHDSLARLLIERLSQGTTRTSPKNGEG